MQLETNYSLFPCFDKSENGTYSVGGEKKKLKNK